MNICHFIKVHNFTGFNKGIARNSKVILEGKVSLEYGLFSVTQLCIFSSVLTLTSVHCVGCKYNP